ncbi:MAG: hypothetical protein ACPG49_00390 [Chitinophagales bacterium]
MQKVFALFLIFISMVCFSQEHTISHIDLTDNEDYSSFQLLDNIETTFYFTSEIHGIEAEQQQFLKMFKYLYEYKNVRNIVLERSHSIAYLLNQYFESADTNYLKKATNTRTEFLSFLKIQKFIKEPIEIIGIDAERFFPPLIDALVDLTEQTNLKEVNTSLHEKLLVLGEKENLSEKKILPLVKDLQSLLIENKLKTAKPEVLINLQKIVDNPSFAGKFQFIINEKDKYHLLQSHTNQENGGNYYAQFGSYHTNLNAHTLAGMMQKNPDSKFQEQVFSIGVHFFDSNSLYGNKEIFHKSIGSLPKKKAKNIQFLTDDESYCIDNCMDLGHDLIFVYKNQVEMK